jgi:hypothetical protein
MMLQLPTLKSCQLSVLTEETFDIFIPSRKNEPFSTIERLVMSHTCDLDELYSILHHTPKLKYLTCQNLIGSDQISTNQIEMALPKLTHVHIEGCRVEFDQFKNFLKKISSELKVLRIDGYRNENFIYPEYWYCLIHQYLPYLAIFKLKCNLLMSHNPSAQGYFDNFNSQFSLQLWVDRGWNLLFDAKSDKISYVISSKRIYDDQMVTYPLMVRYPVVFSTPIELCMINYSAFTWKPSFIDLINPILCSIQFTSLHLFWSGMSIGAFIKLLNQLPNLVSLKLSSSLLFLREGFDKNDENKLRINNKITKVWLWMEMKHVTTLIELCPLMEHFEVNGIKDSELTPLVHFILTKTKTHILRLHSLCLYTYNTNDQMVKKLQKMIDDEHLLFDYMIRRSDNMIALQWHLT